MCGIVGIFDTQGNRDIDREALRRMNESQHHRGPDEGELYLEKALGMGHRRLSVIDVAGLPVRLAYVIVEVSGHRRRAVWTCVWTIIRLATCCNVSPTALAPASD